jgi:glutaredoxin
MLVVGTENCSQCAKIKQQLIEKGVDFDYKILDDFTIIEQTKLINEARATGNLSMPLIFNDKGKCIKHGDAV